MKRAILGSADGPKGFDDLVDAVAAECEQFGFTKGNVEDAVDDWVDENPMLVLQWYLWAHEGDISTIVDDLRDGMVESMCHEMEQVNPGVKIAR